MVFGRVELQLGSDYKNVRTDVSDLVELGLLDKDGEVRVSAPHDEIVIQATIGAAS